MLYFLLLKYVDGFTIRNLSRFYDTNVLFCWNTSSALFLLLEQKIFQEKKKKQPLSLKISQEKPAIYFNTKEQHSYCQTVIYFILLNPQYISRKIDILYCKTGGVFRQQKQHSYKNTNQLCTVKVLSSILSIKLTKRRFKIFQV